MRSPILFGSTKDAAAAWVTMSIDDILGGTETIADLQTLALDREYLVGIPTFLHSGWFQEGLRTYS